MYNILQIGYYTRSMDKFNGNFKKNLNKKYFGHNVLRNIILRCRDKFCILSRTNNNEARDREITDLILFCHILPPKGIICLSSDELRTHIPITHQLHDILGEKMEKNSRDMNVTFRLYRLFRGEKIQPPLFRGDTVVFAGLE